MDKKYIAVILIVAAVAVIAAYFLLGSPQEITTEHNTLILSKSAYMEVPKYPNATSKADKDGIFYYKDKSDDINITSSSNLSASSSAKEMKKLKNSVATGSKKLKEGDVVIYEKNGTYSVFVKNTQYNDTLLIQSSNKDLLLQCWYTVKYHDPTDKIKFNDTNDSSSGSVINAVEKTESAVKESTAETSSSTTSTESTYTESSYSDSGSGGYSDFGFSSSSSSSSGSSSRSSGSSGGGYSDFGFD